MFISVHPTAKTAPQTAKGWRVCQATSMTHLAEIVVGKVWSNCVWNYCRRISTEFKESYFLALDFDSPETTLLQAIKEWCDTRHVIGTTKSHGKEKHGIVCDRFRIIAPWSETIFSLNTFKQNQKRCIKLYNSDPACSGAAQLYFPCKDIVSVNEEGYGVDVQPERVYMPRNPRKMSRLHLPRDIVEILQTKIIPKGSRNKTFFRVIIVMMEFDYENSEIFNAVINSPTYRSEQQENQKEIAATINSAAKTLNHHAKESE